MRAIMVFVLHTQPQVEESVNEQDTDNDFSDENDDPPTEATRDEERNASPSGDEPEQNPGGVHSGM